MTWLMAVDVDAAGRDVGGDEHAGFAGAERRERALPGALRLVAVDRLRLDALLRELLGDAVGAVLGPREDDHLRHLRFGQQPRQLRRLLGGREVIDALVDALDRCRLAAPPRSAAARAACRPPDARSRSAWSPRTAATGALSAAPRRACRMSRMKPMSSMRSASSRTSTSTPPRSARRCFTRSRSRAGGGDDDVDAAGERRDLRPLLDAAEDHGMAERQVFRIGAQLLADLDGELARRRQDQRAGRRGWRAGGERQPVQDRQHEGRRLAGAGLRDAQDVAPLELGGDRPRLDRRRVGVAARRTARRIGSARPKSAKFSISKRGPFWCGASGPVPVRAGTCAPAERGSAGVSGSVFSRKSSAFGRRSAQSRETIRS